MILFAQDATLPTQLQGPAWAVGIAIVLWALSQIVKNVLELRWNAGSKANIEEMKARAEILKAENEAKLAQMKLAQLDADDITNAYEEKLKETIVDCKTKLQDLDNNAKIQMQGMQAHIDIIDKKLDVSEQRERNCIGELNLLKGRLQVIETLEPIKQQIEANKAAIRHLEVNGISPTADESLTNASTGVIKNPDTKEVTGEIKMDTKK